MARQHDTPFDTRYCLFDTAFGRFGIAWSDRGVTRLQLPEADAATTEARLRGSGLHHGADKPPPPIRRAIGMVRKCLDGHRVDFTAVPLDLSGSIEFHQRVYVAARGIGWGQTTSYGALAGLAGAPGAARAVGTALARNPVSIIIPCHRVLASGGRLGGYSAHGGLALKQRLLALEAKGAPDH